MRSCFVALILNSILVETESKTESWFERKMCLKIANQFKPSHPPANVILTPVIYCSAHPSPPHESQLSVLTLARILKWKFDKKLPSGRCIGFPGKVAAYMGWGPAHIVMQCVHQPNNERLKNQPNNERLWRSNYSYHWTFELVSVHFAGFWT